MRKIHRLSRTRLYRIYTCMKGRCYNKSHNRYKYYGSKGVTICEEWLNDFCIFYQWAQDNHYQDSLTIDRMDRNGNYEPGNCRLATYSEQSINRGKLKSNTSGYTGVNWCNTSNRWVCRIMHNKISKCIGYFKCKHNAADARNKYIDQNKLKHKKSIIMEMAI